MVTGLPSLNLHAQGLVSGFTEASLRLLVAVFLLCWLLSFRSVSSYDEAIYFNFIIWDAPPDTSIP